MSEKPPAKVSKSARAKPLDVDYRSQQLPAHVREVIEAHLAIESEDARRAGSLGFMARAMVLATMPYRDPKADVFTRENGDFRLRILAGYEGGIPYGIYPRLLLSWVTTEALRTKSREIELGPSLASVLRNVLDLRSRGGGERGGSTRVVDQMGRLFGSLVTARYTGGLANRGFQLRNVLIADDLNLHPDDIKRFDNLDRPAPAVATSPAAPGAGATVNEDDLWLPQNREEAGKWKSVVRLSQKFFEECVENPVPIDLRAFKALRGSVMAMDVYAWLTYRMAYTTRTTRPIPWGALQLQFGTSLPNDDQGQRDFKKAFVRNLKLALTVYPEAKVDVLPAGLVLHPSPTHIPPAPKMPQITGQPRLF